MAKPRPRQDVLETRVELAARHVKDGGQLGLQDQQLLQDNQHLLPKDLLDEVVSRQRRQAESRGDSVAATSSSSNDKVAERKAEEARKAAAREESIKLATRMLGHVPSASASITGSSYKERATSPEEVKVRQMAAKEAFYGEIGVTVIPLGLNPSAGDRRSGDQILEAHSRKLIAAAIGKTLAEAGLSGADRRRIVEALSDPENAQQSEDVNLRFAAAAAADFIERASGAEPGAKVDSQALQNAALDYASSTSAKQMTRAEFTLTA